MGEKEQQDRRRQLVLWTVLIVLSLVGFGVAHLFDVRGRSRLSDDMQVEVVKIKVATLVNAEEPQRKELADRWEELRMQVVAGKADLLTLAKARVKVVRAIADGRISGEEIDDVMGELE